MVFNDMLNAEENGIPSATLQLEQEVNPAFNLNNGKEDESGKEYYSNAEESDIFERYKLFKFQQVQALYFCA